MTGSFTNSPKRGFVKTRPALAAVLGLGMLLALGILLAYAVTQGWALNDSAQRFDTSAAQEEPAQANSEEAFDSAYAGRTQEMSDALGTTPSRKVDINEVDHRLPVDAPLRGDPKTRDRATYGAVVDQFAVEENPRYSPRKDITTASYNDLTFTYCHIFVWDVTRAMGAGLPYWVGQNHEIKEPQLTEDGQWTIWHPVYWLSANGINQWLNEEGPRYGWREVPAKKAQELANRGHPAVASVYEPYGFGHIGMVRPGEPSNGPALAQAGTRNVNQAHVYDYFPHEGTQFFVNDAGSAIDSP